MLFHCHGVDLNPSVAVCLTCLTCSTGLYDSDLNTSRGHDTSTGQTDPIGTWYSGKWELRMVLFIGAVPLTRLSCVRPQVTVPLRSADRLADLSEGTDIGKRVLHD